MLKIPTTRVRTDSRPDKKPDAAVDIDDAMIEEVKEDPFKSGESGPANKNARTDHGKTGKR